jgi:quinol monooxygenase YgiN
MSALTVIAHYRAQPGTSEDIAALLARHAPAVRAERGCLQFLVYRSRDHPDEFALYEQNVDEAAFEAHRQTEHFRVNIENGVVPLLATREWQRYELMDSAED